MKTKLKKIEHVCADHIITAEQLRDCLYYGGINPYDLIQSPSPQQVLDDVMMIQHKEGLDIFEYVVYSTEETLLRIIYDFHCVIDESSGLYCYNMGLPIVLYGYKFDDRINSLEKDIVEYEIKIDALKGEIKNRNIFRRFVDYIAGYISLSQELYVNEILMSDCIKIIDVLNNIPKKHDIFYDKEIKWKIDIYFYENEQ